MSPAVVRKEIVGGGIEDITIIIITQQQPPAVFFFLLRMQGGDDFIISYYYLLLLCYVFSSLFFDGEKIHLPHATYILVLLFAMATHHYKIINLFTWSRRCCFCCV